MSTAKLHHPLYHWDSVAKLHLGAAVSTCAQTSPVIQWPCLRVILVMRRTAEQLTEPITLSYGDMPTKPSRCGKSVKACSSLSWDANSLQSNGLCTGSCNHRHYHTVVLALHCMDRHYATLAGFSLECFCLSVPTCFNIPSISFKFANTLQFSRRHTLNLQIFASMHFLFWSGWAIFKIIILPRVPLELHACQCV